MALNNTHPNPFLLHCCTRRELLLRAGRGLTLLTGESGVVEGRAALERALSRAEGCAASLAQLIPSRYLGYPQLRTREALNEESPHETPNNTRCEALSK